MSDGVDVHVGAVAHLSRDDALTVIDSMIASLESQVTQ